MTSDKELNKVIHAYNLGKVEVICLSEGTATAKYEVRSKQRRFVIRLRPSEFAQEELIRFDHEVLGRLQRSGLPVPNLQKCGDGKSFLAMGEKVWEVLSWVDGEKFEEGNEQSIYHLGEFLGRFHKTLQNNIPFGKEGWKREDNPESMAGLVSVLEALCKNKSEKNQLKQISEQIDMVKEKLDEGLYGKLPKAVIHGDVHPGNFRFRAGQVNAVYDFDYLSEQARARDISDGLIFFAARRAKPIQPVDIYSLTQVFKCDFQQSKILVEGYQNVSRLTDLDWESLPWLMRSRWIQIRLRGSRKLKQQDKVSFVLDRFFEIINWLDNECKDYFNRLRIAVDS